MFDYLIVGAGFAGSVLAERLAGRRKQARADLRQAQSHRRERVRPLQRARHSGAQVRAAHLPYQLDGGVRISVAVHRVAALRASRAGQRRRDDAADSDQSRHDQPALWDESDFAAELDGFLRLAGRAYGDRLRRRKTWWSARSDANSTKNSSAATRGSSGVWILRSWMPR